MLLLYWAAFVACGTIIGQTKPATAKAEEKIEKPGNDFLNFVFITDHSADLIYLCHIYSFEFLFYLAQE